MVNLFQVIGLVPSSPSLRGHTLQCQLPAESGVRVFHSVERKSLKTFTVYIPRPLTNSVAGLVETLAGAGINFEALRLRNGDLCCVTEVAGATTMGSERALVGESQLGNLGARKWTLAVTAIGVLAAAFLVVANSLFEPNRLPSTANNDELSAKSPISEPLPLVADCSKLHEESSIDLKNYLEHGLASEALDFEVVSSIQIGGLRSVELTSTCKTAAAVVTAANSTKSWRVGLAKSELSWKVTKMTRLEN